MTRTATVGEVIRIALGLEASAAELYRQAAAQAAQVEVRETLLGLAEMEDQHLRVFRALRQSLAQPLDDGGGSAGRGADLLEAWLGGEVFRAGAAEPVAAPPRDDSVESWLATATEMEKESIALYSGLREMVPGDQQAVVDSVIAEELRHLASLGLLLRSLRRTGAPPPHPARP